MAARTDSLTPEPPRTRASSNVAAGSTGIAGITRVPTPVNEPNLSYLPGSPEHAALKERLKAMAGERIDIPVVIGGREIRTGRTHETVMPHDHKHVLADWHAAGAEHVREAIAAANRAARECARLRWDG